MSEIPGNRYELGENRNTKNISVFDSKKYQNELQGFYNINKNNPQTIQTLKDFVDKQEKDKLNVKEKLENPVLQEAREGLDKQAMINEAKTMLYEKLGIDNNQNNNSSFENFEKGIVDELILNNYDLAIQVWETNGKVILDGLSTLASWEGLKQIAESIGESFLSLLTGNAYEKGKSVAELGLIGSGIGAGVYVGKKTLKLGMKQISKLRVNKEMLVQSPDIKNIVGETNNKLDKILPKKQLDFEKALVGDIVKLGDKDRIDAGSFYLKRNLIPEQQEAIIKAHNIGKNREGAGIYNYNQAEITEKVKILKDAGFDKGERKILLEKGICGKEVNKDLLDIEFVSNRMRLSDFENLPDIEKLDILGLPKEFVDLLNDSGFLPSGFDLIERYKKLQYGDIFLKKKKPIDYQTMIRTAVEKLKDNGINEVDAMLLFASTDKYLFNNINDVLRKKIDLPENKKKLIDRFDEALAKMPDLEGKHIIRGDSHYSWLTKKEIKIDGRVATNLEISELIKRGEVKGLEKGSKITLDGYTYVADKKNDIFIGLDFKDNDTLIIIKGDRGGIKDISLVSMYKNFGDRLPGFGNTDVEGIIQRGTKVEFIDSRVFSNATFNGGNFNREVVITRVKK